MTMANTENRGVQDDPISPQGGSAREQIREVKNQVVNQARNSFEQARERAQSSLGESKNQLADQIGSLADALRRTTEHLRSEEQTRFAGLTDTLARQINQVANYVRDKDAAAMRNDLENLARRQPAVVLGGALVLGLVGARFFKSSERRRERRWDSGREQRYAGEGPSSAGSYAGGRYPGIETGGGYAGA